MKSENRGLARLIAAWQNSRRGFADAWQREEAFRQETIALLVAIPVAFLIASSLSQAALMIGSILFLMLVEVINSAIEATIDRIGEERHELSRIAKDLGSTAVFIAFLFPAGVWIAVIASKLNLITL